MFSAVLNINTGHNEGAIHAQRWKVLLKMAQLPADNGAEPL